MRLYTVADATAQQIAVATMGGATAAASWIGFAREWALELFGVPLPVVLAAAAGAFLARTFMPPTTMLRATGSFIAWTLTAGLGAELARSVIEAVFIQKELPPAASAGFAAIFALAGSLLLTMDLIERAKAALARYIDGKWKGGPDA